MPIRTVSETREVPVSLSVYHQDTFVLCLWNDSSHKSEKNCRACRHCNCRSNTGPTLRRVRYLRVATAIVDPLGRAQSLIVGAPVEEAGVDVQRVQQVGGGPDYPGATTTTTTLLNLRHSLCVPSPLSCNDCELTCRRKPSSSQLPYGH